MDSSPKGYQVVDGKTGDILSTHTTRAIASRKVDRLDNAYGAYRYHVRVIW